jgi:uncharacterized HAD superfamily protein
MEHNRIGIDFDDVLFQFNRGFLPWYNKNFGTSVNIEDINSFDMWNVLGCTREEGIERVNTFYATIEHSKLRPFPNGIDSIKKLKMAGKELYVISARNENIREYTERLLDENYGLGNFKEVILTNGFGSSVETKTKASICLDKKITVMIDDNVQILSQCREAGIETVLRNRPWNKQFYFPNRAGNWREILGYIE